MASFALHYSLNQKTTKLQTFQINYWKFGIGNYHIFLINLFGDLFDIEYELDKKSADIDDGWSSGAFILKFSQNEALRDQKEIIAS